MGNPEPGLKRARFVAPVPGGFPLCGSYSRPLPLHRFPHHAPQAPGRSFLPWRSFRLPTAWALRRFGPRSRAAAEVRYRESVRHPHRRQHRRRSRHLGPVTPLQSVYQFWTNIPNFDFPFVYVKTKMYPTTVAEPCVPLEYFLRPTLRSKRPSLPELPILHFLAAFGRDQGTPFWYRSTTITPFFCCLVQRSQFSNDRTK